MSMLFHQITKIVRALWLAERSVCMRVCKHGCSVKIMLCLSRANHASTNLKTFLSSKHDKFTLFTHSFVGWNLENRYKEGVSIFCRLSWHFQREKPVFWRHLFCKTKTDYAYKLRVQDFATGKNFSFNQCAKQRFLLLKCRLLGNRALELESRVRTGSTAWLQSERLRRRLVVMGILLICKWSTTY